MKICLVTNRKVTTLNELSEDKAKLLGSLLLFTTTFYKLRTGRDFVVSEPIGRESHHITICRELTKAFYQETNRLLINVPPGHAKSTLLQHFVAWAMAHYPDSQFIYISYGFDEAVKNTSVIKEIIELPFYRKLFNISIRNDSSAKDNFKTIQGGVVKAFGSNGPVTGKDAGLPNLNRFSGALIMDDMHKPDQVHSDPIREGVIQNYKDTIKSRRRAENVPFIFIGQRLHENDLPNYFISGEEGYEWRKVILKALDRAGNVLCPSVMSKESLLIEQERNPYFFCAQQQQEPSPAGGGIFKESYFVLKETEPKLLRTFITVDGAETEDTFNDATVFSFWGVYKIDILGIDINQYALHLIDCVELHVEPKDLEYEFNKFYLGCLQHKVKPMMAGVEKKSAGVTLCSLLRNKQGLQLIEIQRTKADGSKTARYLEAQPFAASKRISLMNAGKLWSLKDNKPVNLFIQHMIKITANQTHRHDDICDTFYDAVKMGLIDEIVYRETESDQQQDEILAQITAANNKLTDLRSQVYGSR